MTSIHSQNYGQFILYVNAYNYKLVNFNSAVNSLYEVEFIPYNFKNNLTNIGYIRKKKRGN